MTTPELEFAFQNALIRREEQKKIYGTYVAAQAIDIGNVRSFNVGDPVPIEHVERFGWLEEGKVVLREGAELPDGASVQAVPNLPSKESLLAGLKPEEEIAKKVSEGNAAGAKKLSTKTDGGK